MLEAAWDRTEALGDVGARAAEDHFVVLPGVRAAINLPRDVQIVPGDKGAAAFVHEVADRVESDGDPCPRRLQSYALPIEQSGVADPQASAGRVQEGGGRFL